MKIDELKNEDNSQKIILDLCGGTGNWSLPYKKAGYKVLNITLPDYDVRTYKPPENVYGILAAPPCTMFSYARTNAKKPRDLKEGMECIRACLDIIWVSQETPVSNYAKYTRLKFWALENPYRALTKNFLGKPCYIFNPWEFGDMYKKETGLWGNFNEPIKTIKEIKGKLKKFDYLLMEELCELKSITGRDKEHCKDDSWKNTKTRQAIRAITPAGFAKAFFEANQ